MEKDQAEPMTIAEPLADLISEILDSAGARQQPLFRPMVPCVPVADRRKAYIDLMKQLGIRYRRCDFDNYEIYDPIQHNPKRPSQQAVLGEVWELAESLPERIGDGSGVVLYGRPGTGKDHLLTALAYSAILQWGFAVQWVNGADLFQQARHLIKTNSPEAWFIEGYTRSQILIISDPLPPKGEASEYSVEILQRILDRRYRDCRSTWATMNVHGGDEAEQRLASPLASRLRHNSLCLRCDWEDFREARK